MKHLQHYILALLAVLLPCVVLAEVQVIDNCYYELDPETRTAVVTNNNGSYNSYTGTVRIREYIEGPHNLDYDVIAIADNAFRGCPGLTQVTIPTTIETIGDNAFYDCSSLTSLSIPNSVETIGAAAFQGCTSLTTITLPRTRYTTISDHLFDGCTSLAEVTVPSKVTSIGSYSFYGCKNLKKATIPSSVTRISSYAFANCSLLSEGNAASVKTLGSYAYQNCGSLVKANFPSIESIGSYAFDGCNAMTTLTLSSALQVIGDCGFRNCSSLTAVPLSDPLTTIGQYAFDGCTNLRAVTLPKTVNSIGEYAFTRCPNLLDLTYAAGTERILRTYALFVERISLPEGATEIVDRAFYQCEKLAAATIPSTVTSIGNEAFGGCLALKDLVYAEGTRTILRTYATALVNVTLPASATSISEMAFYGCSKLNNVTLPAALTSIGSSAFQGCTGLTNLIYAEGTRTALRTYATSLTTVTIPSSVKAFAPDAFYQCNKLSRINVTSLEMWNYIFQGRTSNPFCCPHTLYLDGKPLTELIADFGRPIGRYAFCQVEMIENVTLCHSITGVDDYAFQDCPQLRSVVIGNQCAYLGQNAFTDCTSLETVRLGSGMKVIGDNAFSGCTEVNSLKLGGNEQTIGSNAFSNCTKLPRLDLSATITTIGSGAFSECHALEEVEVPAGVTEIRDRTFYNCYSMQRASMPTGISSVGQSAFYNCDLLREIRFGDSLTTISGDAFNNCDALRYVYLGTGIRSIGANSFANLKDLTGFFCGAVSVPTTASSAFSNTSVGYTDLFVPDESKSLYASKSPWSDFVKKTLSDAPVFVTRITLEPNVLVLEEDECTPVSAQLYPANATDQRVSWRSENTNVVSVDRRGNVDAYMEGVTTITCKASDGYGAQGTCTVIVCNNYIPLETLTLNQSEVKLTEGEEYDLTATVAPLEATYPEVLWSSSDEHIAVVDGIGRITTLRKGECIITCMANDGSGLKAECHVTVQEPVYASLVVIGDVTGDGEVQQSDLDAVTELLLGKRQGVDLTMADVNGDEVVNVGDILRILAAIRQDHELPAGKLTLLELPSEQYEMLTRETLSLKPVIVPYRAAKNTAWSSSDVEVAVVDEQGRVQALSPGMAIITIAATDGSGLSVECVVTVAENPYGETDGYTWVDLGLPSGTRWATMNVGASTPEQAGQYFAWGETAEQDPKNYTWSNYTYSDGTATTLNKYCKAASYGKRDDKKVLDATDDAAHELWSSQWGIPSQTQWAELVDAEHTTTEFTTQNGVMGLKVTSKVNGNSLFLPAAGYYNDDKLTSGNTGGYYASHDLGSVSSKNYVLNFGATSVNAEDEAFRCYGQSIRPVLTTSIQLSNTNLYLDVQQEYSLSATIAGNDQATITWRSSDLSVAAVDQTGKVTPLKYGTVKIYAVLADANEITAHCDVTVLKPVVTMSVSIVRLRNIGETYQLSVSVSQNSGSLPVTWESADPSIATVNNTGLVTSVSRGITTVKAIVNGVIATCTVNTSSQFNGHAYVDLGLKDAQGRTVYWATCNVGADKPEDAGLYFAWGETVGYTSDTSDGRRFDWANYKWMKSGCSSWGNITKYTFADNQTSADWYSNGKFIGDNKTVLDPEDDAAHVNWGGDWRMPTYDELNQLKTKCTWTWDSTKKGYTVKGPNGNSIFLPAAGYRIDSYLSRGGSYGYYWSSSLDTSDSDGAYCLYFSSGYVDWRNSYRYLGQSVRAVCVSSE